MIWDTKKFNREINAIKSLKDSGDFLTSQELNEIKQKVFQNIHSQPQSAPAGLSLKDHAHRLLRYIISFLVGVSLIGGTAFASGGSKPGDVLYPFKRATEKAQVSLALTEQSKANLQAKFAHERLKELEELAEGSKNKSDTEQNIISNNTPVATSTASSTQTTTTTLPSQSSEQAKIQVQAKQEAKTEVRQAVQALKRVQEKLEAKGNSQAAAQINNNIIQLQNHAHEQNINTQDTNDGNENDDSVPAQQSQVKGASDVKVKNNENKPDQNRSRK